MSKLRNQFNAASKDVSAVTEESRVEENFENSNSNISDVAPLRKRNRQLSTVIEDVSSSDSGNRSLGERTNEQEIIVSKRRRTEPSTLRENGRL